MIKKKIVVFFAMFSATLTIVILYSLSCLSCGEKNPTYKEQFNLRRFKIRQFDLYYPIPNIFKLDPIQRKELPNYYSFDTYFDINDIARYSFMRAESFGFLFEFKYNDSGQILASVIYPILVDSISDSAGICINQYYYINGKLAAYRDELNGNLILIDGDSAFIYEGILSDSINSFSKKKINPNEYIIPISYKMTGMSGAR